VKNNFHRFAVQIVFRNETVASFLKDYIDERLRDPETRALNHSAAFREARGAILGASTPEELGRIAASFLRVNVRRGEEWRRHLADSAGRRPPDVPPLGTRERNLLFFGRAPDHHTREMRLLRINYGLSRAERAAQVAELREGRVEPSAALKAMLGELHGRRTAKAVAHSQAGVINEKVSNTSSVNLYRLGQSIPPHEQTYLYKLAEERKHAPEASPRHLGRGDIQPDGAFTKHEAGHVRINRVWRFDSLKETLGAVPTDPQVEERERWDNFRSR